MQTVVQTENFIAAAKSVGLSDDEVAAIVSLLASHPTAGNLIKGTGGARKVRIAGRGKGKSGGYRTIYYFASNDIPIFLLYIYSKGDRANLTKAERDELSRLLPRLAVEYRSPIQRDIER